MLISLENQLRILAKFPRISHLRFCPRIKNLKQDFHLENSSIRRRYQYHFQSFLKLIFLNYYDSRKIHFLESPEIRAIQLQKFPRWQKLKLKRILWFLLYNTFRKRIQRKSHLDVHYKAHYHTRYKFCQKNDANEFYGYYENFENFRMDSN